MELISEPELASGASGASYLSSSLFFFTKLELKIFGWQDTQASRIYTHSDILAYP